MYTIYVVNSTISAFLIKNENDEKNNAKEECNQS